MGNLTDKEYAEYKKLSLLIICYFAILVLSLGYLIFLVVYSFIYHFNHDTLTVMQVFKIFAKQYILAGVVYIASTSFLKSSYKSWSDLNEKKDGLG